MSDLHAPPGGWSKIPAGQVSVQIAGLLEVNDVERLAKWFTKSARRLGGDRDSAFFRLLGAALAEAAIDLRHEDSRIAFELDPGGAAEDLERLAGLDGDA